MLRNLVGIVSGGASGLGKATAARLVEEGCKVFICDLKASAGQQVADSLGSSACFIPTDIRSTDDVSAMYKNVYSKEEKIDFVVNCAGLAAAKRVFNFLNGFPHELGIFERVVDTNVIGTFNMIRHAVGYIGKNMPNEDGLCGTIINTAGIEAFDGQLGQTVTAAASGAIVSMTLPLARDLAERGIRVNCICTGIMDTPLTDVIPQKIRAHIAQSCAAPKRLGKPEEFAHTVKFILENQYLNAEVIRLDGALKVYFE